MKPGHGLQAAVGHPGRPEKSDSRLDAPRPPFARDPQTHRPHRGIAACSEPRRVRNPRNSGLGDGTTGDVLPKIAELGLDPAAAGCACPDSRESGTPGQWSRADDATVSLVGRRAGPRGPVRRSPALRFVGYRGRPWASGPLGRYQQLMGSPAARRPPATGGPRHEEIAA
jgi:hypothetical protein